MNRFEVKYTPTGQTDPEQRTEIIESMQIQFTSAGCIVFSSGGNVTKVIGPGAWASVVPLGDADSPGRKIEIAN